MMSPECANQVFSASTISENISESDICRQQMQATRAYAEELYNIGVRSAEGIGVQKDRQKANLMFCYAARMGHSGAEYAIGLAAYTTAQSLLRESVVDDWTRLAAEQRYRRAVEWLSRAADSRHAGAQYLLGLMYAYGLGVKKDRAEAAKWFRFWSASGSAEEKYNLGVLYASGIGFPKDKREAARWNFRAATEGHAKAQYKLAVMHRDGVGGPQDHDQATYWLKRAADRGNTDALRQLGPGYRLVRFCAVVAKRCNVQLRSWLRRRW